MTQQARILSFDEIRQDSAARLPHTQDANTHLQSRGALYRSVKHSPKAHSKQTLQSKQTVQSSVNTQERNEAPKPSVSRLRLRLEKFRRTLLKKRASRAFSKSYSGEQPSDASSETSRAALYKAEMGASQRRAARMQQQLGSTSGSPRIISLNQHRQKNSSAKKRILVSAAAFVCVVLIGAVLYTPAQQLYFSVRDRDQKQAEYAAIEQRNTDIQSLVDALSTDEGVKDSARSEFGWVEEGEHAVSVYGLESEDDSSFVSAILPGSVEAPDTWYSELLGPIFGES